MFTCPSVDHTGLRTATRRRQLFLRIGLAAIASMAFAGFAAESALATYGQIIIKKVNVGGPANDLFKFDVSSDMKATGVATPPFSGTQFTQKGGGTQTFGTSFECNVGGSAAGCGPARTYTVTEAAASQPAGYLLTALACKTTNGSTDSDSTTNLATGVANIKISHLEVVTCTYTNTYQYATLRVIKQVVNDNGGTAAASAFSLHVKKNGADVANSPAPGSTTGTDYFIPVGTYAVSEDAAAGYAMTGISGACSAQGTVTLAAGELKTCTVTNNDQAAHLTVIKHVVNDDGGTAGASAFQMDVTAIAPSSAHFAGSEAGNTISVNPGAYSVDESGGPSGYAKSSSANCAGTIAIGQDKTCTITNNDQAAHLTVVKHVVGGGSASAFNMIVEASHPSDASFAGAESPGHTISLDAGSYSVTEGDHTHYTQDRSAGCEGSVGLGQTKTCTITNTKTATVVVEKVTDPAQTGEERDSFGFHTTLPGAGTFSLVHGGTETREVVPGSYTVTEDDPRPAGYKLTDLTCTEDGANDSSTPAAGELASARVAAIVAQAGETVHCTFTNTQVHASITVVKSGPDFAYHGDTLHFEFAVTNSGASPLHGVTVSDDKCPDVSAEPIRRENDNGDSFLDHVGQDGETPEKWVFACSMPMPAHAADEADPLVNKATATGLDEYDRSVEAVDHHETDILHPAIKIAKGGPARATAGALVRYALVVTNPGDQPFADGLVNLTDAKCEAPPALYSKNGDASPATLDPGDTWTFTCAVQTTAGQTSVHNTATVTGTDPHEKVVTDTDSADTALDQPAGGVLGVTAHSAAVAGAARLRGPSGCAAKRTKAYVTGKQIASVRFTLDGHRLATMSRPNSGNRYQVHITPRSLHFGVHKVVARVKFVAASNTKTKTLRLAFQRCGHVARVRFTG